MNKTFKAKIELDKKTVVAAQKLLNYLIVDMALLGYKRQETVETYTAVFENGFQADIKLCASIDDFFIDSVLFTPDGVECGLLDVKDEILGEYIFKQDDDSYIVEIIEA